MSQNESWMQRDLAVLWHPCTQMKDHEQLPLIPIRRGEGVWLEDFDGKRYIDAVSSWWVNVFGHANPRINQRIKDQLDQLEHVMLAGFSHQPVVELSERLVALTPPGLERVFYTDNGSTGIEVALKMSFHYWRNSGQPSKQRFVTLTNSYHGETVAAMSVGDVALFTDTYKPLLLDTFKVPSPDCYLRPEGMSWEEHSRNMFAHMEQTLAEHHREIAAVIVEPMSGSAGVILPPLGYLQHLREITKKHGILLIFDEVITGFGRVGEAFAAQRWGVTPDILTCAKGLTNGAVPMGAVFVSEQIHEAFMHGPESTIEFFHGYTYSGHPVACAAALATQEIYQRENLFQKAIELESYWQDALFSLQGLPNVTDIRTVGLVAGIQFAPHAESVGRRGYEVFRQCFEDGLLARASGDTIALSPALIVEREHIDAMVERLADAIRKAA
ncbi:MAG TPA: adenosylmethionine--8-amino-7-oxononanoate transaminase [Pseudomonas sp.]|nr:adenosylmethionine--8-amino-7-oxononanoate transaminase [Pseudomonas sp.]